MRCCLWCKLDCETNFKAGETASKTFMCKKGCQLRSSQKKLVQKSSWLCQFLCQLFFINPLYFAKKNSNLVYLVHISLSFFVPQRKFTTETPKIKANIVLPFVMTVSFSKAGSLSFFLITTTVFLVQFCLQIGWIRTTTMRCMTSWKSGFLLESH